MEEWDPECAERPQITEFDKSKVVTLMLSTLKHSINGRYWENKNNNLNNNSRNFSFWTFPGITVRSKSVCRRPQGRRGQPESNQGLGAVWRPQGVTRSPQGTKVPQSPPHPQRLLFHLGVSAQGGLNSQDGTKPAGPWWRQSKSGREGDRKWLCSPSCPIVSPRASRGRGSKRSLESRVPPRERPLPPR